jgi:hypothetical protein
VAERVTTVGGAWRSVDGVNRPDLAQRAVEVISPGTFCKTITIEHQP